MYILACSYSGGRSNRLFVAFWQLNLAHFARTCPLLRCDLSAHAINHQSLKMTEKTAHGTLLSAVSQYLEMMYDGDLSRFDAVFAPTAQLHGVQEGQVRVLPAAEYLRLLSSRPSPKSKNAPRQQEILLIDIASSSQALVKVRVRIDDALFVDYLSYHLIGGAWL